MNSGSKKKSNKKQPDAKQGTTTHYPFGPLDKWVVKSRREETVNLEMIAHHELLQAPNKNHKENYLTMLFQKEDDAIRTKILEIQSDSCSPTRRKICLLDGTEEERADIELLSRLVLQSTGQGSTTSSDGNKSKNTSDLKQQQQTDNRELLNNNLEHHEAKSLLSKLCSAKSKNDGDERQTQGENFLCGRKYLDDFTFGSPEVVEQDEIGPFTMRPKILSLFQSSKISVSKTQQIDDEKIAETEKPTVEMQNHSDEKGSVELQQLEKDIENSDFSSLEVKEKKLKRSELEHQNISLPQSDMENERSSSPNKEKGEEEVNNTKEMTPRPQLADSLTYSNQDKENTNSPSLLNIDPQHEKIKPPQQPKRMSLIGAILAGEYPKVCHDIKMLSTVPFANIEGALSSPQKDRDSLMHPVQTQTDDARIIIPEDIQIDYHKRFDTKNLPTPLTQMPIKQRQESIIFHTSQSPMKLLTLCLDSNSEPNQNEHHPIRNSERANNEPLANKLKQERNGEPAESERFLPFKLSTPVEKMDLNHYIDLLTLFVKEHKIYFTTDVEAEEYFEKCDRRCHWGFGLEWIRILNVLRGINTQKMVKDKEAALRKFLIVIDERTKVTRLDLSQTADYCKFAQHLKNSHGEDFNLLLSFLKSHDALVAYMRMIIRAPYGYFPGKGATQNLVLWLCGKTQCGKTSLAAIITSFLVVCKMRATNEKFMNTCGDNNIRNKPLSFNIFQLEELKKSGKGAADLMDLMDAGVSVIKGKEASGWGSDNKGDAYHFPILITSNYYPAEIFSSKNVDERLFQEAALSRIICIEINRSTLPNVSRTNRFGISRLELAQFVWAFVYHSEIEPEFGDVSPKIQRRYEDPESVELTLQELSLAAGKKVLITSLTSAIHQPFTIPIKPSTLQPKESSSNNPEFWDDSISLTGASIHSNLPFNRDTLIETKLGLPLDLDRRERRVEMNKRIKVSNSVSKQDNSVISRTSSHTQSSKRSAYQNITQSTDHLSLVGEFMYGISLYMQKLKPQFIEVAKPVLYQAFLNWMDRVKYVKKPAFEIAGFSKILKTLNPSLKCSRIGERRTSCYIIDYISWLNLPAQKEWQLINVEQIGTLP